MDDLVGEVADKLRSRQVLDDTYTVFTSDNGWYHGEHRIRHGKGRPYEEAARVPLAIRGPDVQAGSTTDKLVLNTDFLPTFTDLAGAQAPSYVDGRSLRPVLAQSVKTWRTAILLEGRAGNDPEIPLERNYSGIRTSTGKYVEYEGGFRELYDLGPEADPYELNNIYDSADPDAPPLTDLKARLDALKQCTGTGPAAPSCEAAEDPVEPTDTTAPRIQAVSPANQAIAVARSTDATATFSERMDLASITRSTFKLFRCPSTSSTNCTTQLTNVTVRLSTDGLRATLDPYGTSATKLASGTRYKAVVTTGARDVAGNALDQNATTAGNQQKSWYFTTGTT